MPKDEEKKTPTPSIEELQEQIKKLQEEKEGEINSLKEQLEGEKKKNLQFTIAGLTKKVETTIKEDEPIEFDFDM